eukprot:8105819-Heterocapsa_arctica.AAC.1
MLHWGGNNRSSCTSEVSHWGVNNRSSCMSEVVIADAPINHTLLFITPNMIADAPMIQTPM